ncbi:MAG: hypothetical protein ACTSU2_17600 [Promethearchaeota archaeon]
MVLVDKYLPLTNYIKKLKSIPDSEFFDTIEKKPEEYFKAELDCIINFKIKFKKSVFGLKKRLVLESKMFTVPLKKEKRLKILESHLSSTKLKKYLGKRALDYYVLLSFSYLHEDKSPAVPLSKVNGAYPYDLKSIWSIHLVFLTSNVLKYLVESPLYNNIKIMAENILKTIEMNQNKILNNLEKSFKIPKNINFRITYNIIKVVLMYEIIEEKDKTIEKWIKRAKELEEEKLKAEQERERLEERLKTLEERLKTLEEQIKMKKEDDLK